MRGETDRALGCRSGCEIAPFGERMIAIQRHEDGQMGRHVIPQQSFRLCKARRVRTILLPSHTSSSTKDGNCARLRDVREGLYVWNNLSNEPSPSQEIGIEVWLTEKGVALGPVSLWFFSERASRKWNIPLFPNTMTRDYFTAIQGHQRFVHGGVKPPDLSCRH